ncbi:MAG: dihydrolipoyl dehydrogenase [Bacteroidia bacterium]|nr:dihydrolipoyl dehydrogenase [Bacteroidia bacterium]
MIFDVVIIGSGPGGYVSAIRCAQLGFKTAIVERYETLGGTCLNVGCIPSKALLDSSEHFYNAQHTFVQHGIEATGLKVNLQQMISRKNGVVSQTVDGINYLMKKNKITVLHGVGAFKSTTEVTVTGNDGTIKNITAKYIIVATGSKPALPKGITTDSKRIITSTEALQLTEIPKQLVIIGGGVIGLELGSVYARLGAKVKVIEYTDGIIPAMDKALGKELEKSLKKLGFEFYYNHKVTEVSSSKKDVTITAADGQNNTQTFTGDYCLVSVGRKPYTLNLGLENIGIQTDESGRIPVNEHLQTTVRNVYAIGDVVRGAMLAHKAEDEGVYVAEFLAGQKPHINYLLIPNVVYTWPEVAAVGYTEEELKTQKIAYKAGSFPFKASGRARASMDLDGFIKVLAHADTDEILGVHMIGPRCADLIAEAVVAMEFRASAEDITRMSHAHPTYTESFKEACLAACGSGAIHL